MKEMVDARFIESKINLNGIGYLDDALTKGKGVIVVTAHIGNWELGAVVLSELGYSITAVALPHRERPVNDLFNHQREVKGVTVIPTKGAFRRCAEQLKDNKVVALVADRTFNASGVMINFLGRKVLMPKGAATLSWKTGAPIVPSFLIRKEDGAFDFLCCEPIYPPTEDTSVAEDEIVLRILHRYMSVIEDQIRMHPSQWLLFREFGVK